MLSLEYKVWSFVLDGKYIKVSSNITFSCRVKIIGHCRSKIGKKWPKNVGRHLWTFPNVTINHELKRIGNAKKGGLEFPFGIFIGL